MEDVKTRNFAISQRQGVTEIKPGEEQLVPQLRTLAFGPCSQVSMRLGKLRGCGAWSHGQRDY